MVGSDLFRADFNLAVEPGELEVGAAGMEVDGSCYVLEMRIAIEVAGQGHCAGDVGESKVVGVSFEGDGTGDLVGGEGGAIVVDVSDDRTCDGGKGDVAVIGSNGERRVEGVDADVAMVGIEDEGRGGGDGQGKVDGGPPCDGTVIEAEEALRTTWGERSRACCSASESELE